MASTSRKRQYADEFINFGFTYILSSGIQKPQCVICYEVLSVESMKPNILKRHFETKHKQYASQDPEFFRHKAEQLKRSRLDSGGAIQQHNKAVLTISYEVSLKLAKAKKPHTLAEEVIMPCAKDIVRHIFGEDAMKKLNPISLSNDTVHRRIKEMSADILSQVIHEMKTAPLGLFALQVDETTDVANLAQLLVYVRYIKNGDFKDEFLFCKTLETTTTSQDVFGKIASFFSEQKLEWKNACGICTDGAPAMLGCRSGFQQLMKKESPQMVGIHCMIHRQVLAARTLPTCLKD
jgi:zinc finger BED domain-containing protein 5/7/8/9